MTTASEQRKWARQLTVLILIAIIGKGGYLRYHELRLSLYGDEIVTRAWAMEPAAYTATNSSYPLLHLATKAALLLGDTELTLRLPSFAAGLLSILVLFGLARQIHSRTAGLMAAGLLAFNPYHINQSHVADYGALLMLFALLTLWTLFQSLEKGRWYHWLAYALSAFLALAAHVSFAPALAALNLGAACYLFCRRERNMARRFGMVCLLACITALSCGPFLYKAGFAELSRAQLQTGAEEIAGASTVNSKPFTVAWLSKDVWMGDAVVEAHGLRTHGSGAPFANPDTGRTRYLLTYYDCLEYLKRFFWTDTTWVWPALILVGVWGMVDLLYRVPALGLPLFFGLFVSPLPLFFFSAGHEYHRRFFSYSFVFATILIAIGLCVLPRFLSRVVGDPKSLRLFRRAGNEQARLPLSVVNVLYALLVMGLAIAADPVIKANYQSYPVADPRPQAMLSVNRAPEQDWRELFQYVARTAKKGDSFLFMSPEDQYGDRYGRYYLSKFLPWAEEEANFDYRYGVPTEGELRRFAQERPMANFWSVGYIKYGVDRIMPFWQDTGAKQISFWGNNRNNGVTLFCLAAPTTNHVANGGFETPLRGTLPDGVTQDVKVVSQGEGSVKIELSNVDGSAAEPATRYASFPVSPAIYRLRNNGFEAWTDGKPVGWQVQASAPEDIRFLRPGFEDSTSLTLAPAATATVLQQSIPMGLAPGRAVEIQMMGKCATPNNLHLVLRYQGPGYQREQHTVHSGSGSWAILNMSEDIPANADPDSIAVEIWRMAGGDEDAFVDNVELRVRDLGGELDPAQPYTLSLMARTEDMWDLRGTSQTPVGHIRLRWEDRAGTSGHYDLIKLHQQSGWRYYTATFVPGVAIPNDLQSLFVEAGLEGGTGSLWVDAIQLEKGSQATLFTDTFRLPHDEALATADLAAHKVGASW